MRKAKPKDIWLERVENLVGVGMPDVMAGGPHFSWVELKHACLPVRATTRVLGNDGLSIDQINWHLVAASFRLPVYTVVRDDSGGIYMIEAAHAASINDWCAADLRANSIAAAWKEVFAVLGSKQ